MSWPLSLFGALLTGLAGMAGAGLIAMGCVNWYHVSSREGESGYFIIAIALVGFLAATVLGLLLARKLGKRPGFGFPRTLGASLGVTAALLLAAGGMARLAADIPPSLDGSPLVLDIEVRWPEGQAASPAEIPGTASLELQSVVMFSNRIRARQAGEFFKGQAHLVNGRWVAPARIPLFTSRGKSVLVISANNADTASTQAFLLPILSHPGKLDLEWTGWFPEPKEDEAPPRYSYRFRVQKVGAATSPGTTTTPARN